MSSQRVIQDSEDESGDNCSDIATSIDPLQDPSLYAPPPPETGDRVRHAEHETEFPASFPDSSNLPRVDFDKYLRSESSIMAGDYEDERWASTADAARPGAFQVDSAYRGQFQDDCLTYQVNAGYDAVPDTLPPTADMGQDPMVPLEHNEIINESEHRSKRRKISLTQNSLQDIVSGKSEPSTSYNYFASFDPNGPSQTATVPSASADLPPQHDESAHNGLLPEVFETPPPTVPFSEDILYEQIPINHESSSKPPEILDHPCDQFPVPEADTEVLSSKKKRGRPKKQALDENVEEDQTEHVPDDMIPQTDQANKRKPGRPKKKERDTSPDELAMDETPQVTTNKTGQLEAASKSEKPAKKKKIKRGKTTSDLPNTNSESKADRDVLWIDDPGIAVQENPASKPDGLDESTIASAAKEEVPEAKAVASEQSSAKEVEEPASEPKKRGRKKKSIAEGPPPADIESPAVLQDISNTAASLPSKNEQEQNEPQAEDFKSNGVNQDGKVTSVELQQGPDDTAPAPAPLAETPTKDDEEIQKTNKALTKHSPIPSTSKVPFRVGLSRRARIAPLLKIVRK